MPIARNMLGENASSQSPHAFTASRAARRRTGIYELGCVDFIQTFFYWWSTQLSLNVLYAFTALIHKWVQDTLRRIGSHMYTSAPQSGWQPLGRCKHAGMTDSLEELDLTACGLSDVGAACVASVIKVNHADPYGQFIYGLNASITGIVAARCDAAAAQWAVVRVGMPVKMTECLGF
eukprot:351893-Chlamydomonas_euryale.AAC.32